MLNIDIQILTDKNIDEMNDLISVFADVFEMETFVHPDREHLSKLLSSDNFMAITAKLDGKVIGGSTVYLLDQYYSTKPLAYIYDFAVSSAYQKKGIGRALIEFLNKYFRQNGFEEVFIQADKMDDYAIDFYRSSGPTNENQVVQFSYILGNDN